MKTLATLAVAAILLSASTTFAGEPGAVSQESLSKFGLSGMKIATPAQAEQVRGMGYAAVSGYSFGSAVFGNSQGFATNSYVAESTKLLVPALAFGGSQSVGEVVAAGGIEGSYSNLVLSFGGSTFSTGSFSLSGGVQIGAFGSGGAFAYAR